MPLHIFTFLTGLSDRQTETEKKDNNSKVLYGFLRGETIKVEHIVWREECGVGGEGVGLKMCEEALSNQVKEKEKK